MTYRSLIPRVLITIAQLLYLLDRHWWRPAGLASDIISWLETRGLCCERHAKQDKVVVV